MADFAAALEKKVLDLLQEPTASVILASDEASLYRQATGQRVWVPIGQTPGVRLDASRSKINFYGTLDWLTGQELVMHSDEINAVATTRPLTQVLDAFPYVSILLLWDKAPWHKGPEIRALLAANPRLEIMSFPTATPELYRTFPVLSLHLTARPLHSKGASAIE